MRTEFESGFVVDFKGNEHEVVFERQIEIIRGSDGLAVEVRRLVGCKLSDGTVLQMIDSHGTEWAHPDRSVTYSKS